ncbi:copper amine oxidase N-terminal domain-containing protein [Paenibacillus sp. BC26]|uniref:copper amine oxidase N-terminal domain-containing protein n=1 Tax=Paenibacillus sp. BC26 TaxID=1881032 RepID=UPI000B803D38|nr:copper amine oxidase N-terminal domain-containing protein [Paenibacillus sp. BC26]
MNTHADAATAFSPTSTAVYVNGQYQNHTITVNGRTLVKLRALTDPAWLVFAYDSKTHTVMFHTKDNSKIVYLREGEKTVTVNGKKVLIDAPVVNKDGLTYVPLRFISETLGANVKFSDKDKQVIVRTPTGQAEYEQLMHGNLTEARQLALQAARILGEAPQCHDGEMYNYNSYTFPEGEALQFTMSFSGYCDQYYEINDDGLAILKWQNDAVSIREWGEKPSFKGMVYFMNEYMSGVFTYGKVDAEGNDTMLGRFYRDQSDNAVFPIENEKRTDAK